MKKLVIPRIFGGLGNQLFIYASARRLALVNNAELILDDVSGFKFDSKYNRNYQLDHFSIPCRKAFPNERLEPFSRIRRSILRRWNRYLPFHRRDYIFQGSNYFDSRLLHIHPVKRLYLEGYWQSELYFKDVESQIRTDLRITPPNEIENLLFGKRMQLGTSVSVHVRFFDESCRDLSASGKNSAVRYYASAVSIMESSVNDAHYYIFSERPEEARALIPLPDHRITVVGHNKGDINAYADLWLMTNCKHFIIANSTFSWWGAWLASHEHKLVLAPKLDNSYRGSWDCPLLLPESWIQI